MQPSQPVESTLPKRWAVIPAAGTGSRFSTQALKQYQYIGNQTVLQLSVACLATLNVAGCVIVLSADDTLGISLDYALPVQFCIGGATRADSVLAGIKALDQAASHDYIIVHDAARPCLHADQIQTIKQFFDQRDATAAIVAVPVRDTLKYSFDQGFISHTVEREPLWQAQTPQIALYGLLRHALQQALEDQVVITDEASALEHQGIPIKLIRGRSDNIKITYPEDLKLAELILKAGVMGGA